MNTHADTLTKKAGKGVDPIRLNLFFDLVLSMSQAENFEDLSSYLGTHLRLVLDFDKSYFHLFNEANPSFNRVYLSSRQSPRLLLVGKECSASEAEVKIERGLLEFRLGIRTKPLGMMRLIRENHFTLPEIRFAEAVSAFLSQTLEKFSTHEELLRTNERLEKESELRERFVATLSHDLRTPITSSKMHAYLIERTTQDNPLVLARTKSIIKCMDRADRMISDHLDTSRIHAGAGISINIGQCQLDELVTSMILEFNEIYGPRFKAENKTGVVSISCDKIAIQRILENLASNAVKYGDPTSAITIGITSNAQTVEISVHNHGLPISAEDQKTLFSQYNRTSSALVSGQRGWGIGLSLVKGIAEAHHGSVRIVSDDPVGTSFIISLPKAQPII